MADEVTLKVELSESIRAVPPERPTTPTDPVTGKSTSVKEPLVKILTQEEKNELRARARQRLLIGLGQAASAVGLPGARVAGAASSAVAGLSKAGAAGGLAVAGGAGAAIAGLASNPVTLAAAAGLVVLTTTLGIAGVAFKKLTGQLDKVSESLGALAPQVAVALAEREVSIIQAQLRRGQRVGRELAEFTSQGTELRVALRESVDHLIEIFAPFFTEILDLLTRVVRYINLMLELFEKLIEVFGGFEKIIINLLRPFVGDVGVQLIKLIFRALNKFLEEDEAESLDDIFEGIQAFLRGDEARGAANAGDFGVGGPFGVEGGGRPGAVFQ